MSSSAVGRTTSSSATAFARLDRRPARRGFRLLAFGLLVVTAGLRMLGRDGGQRRLAWRRLARSPADDWRRPAVVATPAAAAQPGRAALMSPDGAPGVIERYAVRPPPQPAAPLPGAPGVVPGEPGVPGVVPGEPGVVPGEQPTTGAADLAATRQGRRGSVARAGLSSWAMAAGVFGVTVGLRLFHLRQAYDVFLDESTYSRISAGAAVDGRLVFGNYPFYLHGPLSFYLQALWIRAFGITGTAIEVIDGLRFFNVLVAGVVAVLAFSIVRSVASRAAALLAAALFAFDPFIISFDSRLFLETLATMWVLLGFYLLLPLAGEGSQRPSAARRRALAGGFAFGLALLTKETSAPLYLLPLLWCIVRGEPLRRSPAVTALVTAALTYLPYPLVVVATGGASQLFQQKFGGIERMLGLVQATGYNRPGAPSLFSRVTADLNIFLMTYVLIALGVLAAVMLYRRGSSRQRLVGIWGLAALSMLAFQIAQGTIEEQMFYYLVVPSIVTVACGLSLVSADLRATRARTAAVLVAFAAIGAFDLVTWVDAHTRSDTAIVRAVAWMQGHAPADTRVAPLADGIQLLLPDYVLLFNPEAGDVSPAQLRAAGTELVITSSLQAEQGYSAASPSLLKWLSQHARRRFAATGASAGTVVVWQLGASLPRSAPPGPEPLKPRAPLSVGAPTYHA